MLDSVIKVKKKYYPETLFEECKYEPKKIKMESVIDDDLEKSWSEESGSESDNDGIWRSKKNLANNLLKAKKDNNNKSNE